MNSATDSVEGAPKYVNNDTTQNRLTRSKSTARDDEDVAYSKGAPSHLQQGGGGPVTHNRSLTLRCKFSLGPPPPVDVECDDLPEPADYRRLWVWTPIDPSTAQHEEGVRARHHHPRRPHGLCRRRTPAVVGGGGGWRLGFGYLPSRPSGAMRKGVWRIIAGWLANSSVARSSCR
jgi:hypothetical protein